MGWSCKTDTGTKAFQSLTDSSFFLQPQDVRLSSFLPKRNGIFRFPCPDPRSDTHRPNIEPRPEDLHAEPFFQSNIHTCDDRLPSSFSRSQKNYDLYYVGTLVETRIEDFLCSLSVFDPPGSRKDAQRDAYIERSCLCAKRQFFHADVLFHIPRSTRTTRYELSPCASGTERT